MASVLAKLPHRPRAAVEWLRSPSRQWPRLLAAALLIAGGVLSILPLLGVWMLPLGLALLSDDLPWLKSPLEHSASWISRTWRKVRKRLP